MFNTMGLGASVLHLSTFSRAAKFRVIAGIEHIHNKWADVTRAHGDGLDDQFKHPFSKWIAGFITGGLISNYVELLNISEIQECCARPKIQTAVYKMLRGTCKPEWPASGLLRRALHWFPVDNYYGQFMQVWLPVLAKRLPPGLVLATVKLLVNGLNTSARYRNTEHGGPVLDCKFCGHLGGDSLWHLVTCPQLALAVIEMFGLRRLPTDEGDGIRYFCWIDQPDIQEMKRRALLADFYVKCYQEVETLSDFRQTRRAIRHCMIGRKAHWLRFDTGGYAESLDLLRNCRSRRSSL